MIWALRVFCCLGGSGAPLKQQPKKLTPPKQQQTTRLFPKENTRPSPFPNLSTAEFDFQQKTHSCSNSTVWARVNVFVFCCLGAGRGRGAGCVFCSAVCAGAGGWGGLGVFVFMVWAESCSFLLFWRGSCFFLFCCLGGWRASFFCCLGTGGSQLTYQSAWLDFKGPNKKNDQTAKTIRVLLDQFTGFLWAATCWLRCSLPGPIATEVASVLWGPKSWPKLWS